MAKNDRRMGWNYDSDKDNQKYNREILWDSDSGLASHADVLGGLSRVSAPRGVGMRDEPLRTCAWEANSRRYM